MMRTTTWKEILGGKALWLAVLSVLLAGISSARAETTPASAAPVVTASQSAVPQPKPDGASAAKQVAVSPEQDKAAQPVEPSATPESELAEKWGIQALSTRLTAGGRMIDFRYRVLDPEKAAKLGDPHARSYIIDEATGAKFVVPSPPKVGQLRNTRALAADKNYFILFANPGNYIKGGAKVSVVVGELKMEHLTVE